MKKSPILLYSLLFFALSALNADGYSPHLAEKGQFPIPGGPEGNISPPPVDDEDDDNDSDDDEDEDEDEDEDDSYNTSFNGNRSTSAP